MYIRHRFIFILPVVFASLMSGYSQVSLMAYLDAGKNVVLSDYYASSSIIASCTYSRFTLSPGVSYICEGHKGSRFEGYLLNGSRQVNFFRRTIDIGVFYLHRPLSEIIKENNWGVYAEYIGKRFEILIGNQFRYYRLIASEDLQAELKRKPDIISENWNIIYSFHYRIISNTSWHLSASVTNLDYFIIEQETNPLFNIKVSYKIRNKVMPYIAYWHRNAGMFNLKANHFGYHFRLGLEWELSAF